MTPQIALQVGVAAALVFKSEDRTERLRVVIGKDTRLSGYMIEPALVAGCTAAGMDVFLLGPIPTPAVAMLTRSLRADLGIMISASHNPFSDNGIKLFGPDGYKLSDETEREIEQLVGEELTERLARPADLGRARRIEGVHDRYIEFAKHTMSRKVDLTGLRVVVDCANGAGYRVAPDALWELGAEVVKIGCSPNGFNINLECGSTDIAALRQRVHEVRADIGIALDGDGDRVIIVDERGEEVDGDQLMATVASSWHESGRLAGGGIVATVMSNLGLERYLTALGLTLERTKVGDRYVVERMRANGFNVGGEQSGHIVLSDYCTTGDGLVTALQILSVVQASGRPVSEVCRRFEAVPQVLRSVRTSPDSLEAAGVKTAIASAEDRLAGNGRLLIRPSGTEPVVRVMAEGDDPAMVEAVVDDIVEALDRIPV